MIEFPINGIEYRAEKLNAFQQLHIMRRLSPLLSTLVPVFNGVAKVVRDKQDGKSDATKIVEMFTSPEMLQPIADALAQMPDEAAEYVMTTCLSAVKQKHGDSWIPVWNSAQKVFMHPELNDLGKMLPVVVRVIQDSLGPFILGLLTSPTAA